MGLEISLTHSILRGLALWCFRQEAKGGGKVGWQMLSSQEGHRHGCLGAGHSEERTVRNAKPSTWLVEKFKPEDIKSCAMWRCENKGFSSMSLSQIPMFGDKFGGYLAYPIGDKNSEATGFTS
jgi:hypothetical protein